MLLLYQSGTVKIGEVVRYTVTYTPSHDRILPAPELLHLRIRNTSSVALRAAFIHGPYTLNVAAYPAHYDPNVKFKDPQRWGVPEFEPMLKAGGTWGCTLLVPEHVRGWAGDGEAHREVGEGKGTGTHSGDSVSWIVEVTSQVLFSTSAGVNFEVLLARDEKSLTLGSVASVVGAQAQVPEPGKVSDFRQSSARGSGPHKGVFSKALRIKVEDTAALWDSPKMPGWDESGWMRETHYGGDEPSMPVAGVARAEKEQEQQGNDNAQPPRQQQKVHLVILTHGLHSNLGADMLYLKESIDAGVKQAKIDAKARVAREREERLKPRKARDATEAGEIIVNEGQGTEKEEEPDGQETGGENDEEVIVRGFSGNATKTEKGIKYLGKRLARYILSMTYPDQPYLPTAKAASDAIAQSLRARSSKHGIDIKDSSAVHKNSTVLKKDSMDGQRLYKITKISFIGHSLGGLVQTYAVAYIQKHSPHFFNLVEPVNFIALASPLLGLNHENPLYVKFALDFGLVGRTGQDLGLTWRAPTIARNGWGAIVSNLGENAHKRMYGDTQSESKPLLRILPTGPAHTALKKFRNRTVYSNVVNDGIVPLRTSCLLFLDWQGLGRVEKARREAGLVETVVGFGWAELTGANTTASRIASWLPGAGSTQQRSPRSREPGASSSRPPSNGPPGASSHDVPQPPSNAILEDDHNRSLVASERGNGQKASQQQHSDGQDSESAPFTSSKSNTLISPLSGLFRFFRHEERAKSPSPTSSKQTRIYQLGQTLKIDDPQGSTPATPSESRVTSGQELSDESESGVSAPPKTSFFESAGDLLNPNLPSVEYLIDPSKRPRAIFHDRIYHPEDIPPPPLKKHSAAISPSRRFSCNASASPPIHPGNNSAGSENSSPPNPTLGVPCTDSIHDCDEPQAHPARSASSRVDSSQMRVEEKIARAYHRGMSWRKVLVKLEPDAHNNIIVRRMFANAFGWSVVHHLVDAHFSDSEAARTCDNDEKGAERAKKLGEPPDRFGNETIEKGEKAARKEKDGPSAHLARRLSEQSLLTLQGKQNSSEARDEVPDLPSEQSWHSPYATRSHGSSSGSSLSLVVRCDSLTWSERDWLDSEDEEASLPGQKSPASAAMGPLAEGGWNWRDKIVGKGAVGRSKSLGLEEGEGAEGEGQQDRRA